MSDFQLVPENDWSAVDAAVMGMPTPQAVQMTLQGQLDTTITPSGTDTSSGKREKPAPKDKPVKRTAADVVEGFGNDFSSMKSTRLSDALRGAQTSIIEKRMAGGADFGFKSTPSTPMTTTDPSNFQDGMNNVADLVDQTRAIDFPKYNGQSFASDPTNSSYEDLFNGNNLTGILTYFKDKK